MSSPAPLPRLPESCPASPIDGINRHDFASAQKSRKYSSTGGGRAWSEQEEVYLLQTRLQKMPYKHIAAHLKKTELACRLHYHQLSHGTNRRKRAASIASSCSSGPSPMTPQQRLSPDVEVVTSEATSGHSPVHNTPIKFWGVPHENSPMSTTDSPQSTQKPLLPRPVATFPNHVRAINKALRLDCRTNFGRPVAPRVNKDRLRQVYESHRASFWKMIAADYGEGADPATLEAAWRGEGVQGLMTPDSSVDSMHKYGSDVVRRLAPSVLPAPRHHESEGAWSPINRISSASPAPTFSSRASYSLPPPSATASPARSASIANLLTDTVDTRRPLRLDTVVSASNDVSMRDAGH
ncbi:MAG: hypothetical protein M1817_002208 [Caeruleum heppii]|nr:MAG: hypothetical protein M1817_002208 [Caeruleum heppii]